jgi:hypothetical protein
MGMMGRLWCENYTGGFSLKDDFKSPRGSSGLTVQTGARSWFSQWLFLAEYQEVEFILYISSIEGCRCLSDGQAADRCGDDASHRAAAPVFWTVG